MLTLKIAWEKTKSNWKLNKYVVLKRRNCVCDCMRKGKKIIYVVNKSLYIYKNKKNVKKGIKALWNQHQLK